MLIGKPEWKRPLCRSKWKYNRTDLSETGYEQVDWILKTKGYVLFLMLILF
jgi:hypothetical protein